jgi:YcaO-like protein with predicted kinase domain
MILESCLKSYDNYKADHPDNTIKRVEEGFARIGLNLSYVGRKNGNCEIGLFSGTARISGTPFKTNGKGLTEALSKASAYAEAVERYSAGAYFVYQKFRKMLRTQDLLFKGAIGDNGLVDHFLSYSFLQGYTDKPNSEVEAMECIDMLLRQYQWLDQPIRNKIHKEFSEAWVNAYCITEDTYCKLPVGLLQYIQIHNGLASGNSLEEAIVHGACEVFERYRALETLKSKTCVPTVDPSSIINSDIIACIKMLRDSGIDVVLKDLTQNGLYPVMGVLFINRNLSKDQNPLTYDFYHKRFRVASSIDLENALIRCFTEEIQGFDLDDFKFHPEMDAFREHWIKRMEMRYQVPSHETYKYYLRQGLSRQDMSFLEDSTKLVSLDSLNSQKNKDYIDDINRIIDICKCLKLPAYVIDYTHKKINFPTVRVVLPTLSDIVGYYASNRKEGVQFFDNQKQLDLVYFDGLTEAITDSTCYNHPTKIEKLIERIEEHLSSYPFDSIVVLDRYGLANANLFGILARACSTIGMRDKSQCYAEMAVAMWSHRIPSGARSEQMQRSEHAKFMLLKPFDDNPFAPNCACEDCRQYGKRIHHMLGTFF